MALPPPIQAEWSRARQRPPASPIDRFVEWARGEGAWWASSFVIHLFLVFILMLGTTIVADSTDDESPDIEEPVMAEASRPAEEVQRFETGDAPPDSDDAADDSLALNKPASDAKETKIYDNSPVFTDEGGGRPVEIDGPSLGGLGGFDVSANRPGAAVVGDGGVGVGVGAGKNPGSGGAGIGFGGRGSGMRVAMVGGHGGTRQTERAVAAALLWLACHQAADGHWSLDHTQRCRDKTCTQPAITQIMFVGPTALGVLPFLAAGQTHHTKGPYQTNVKMALQWLLSSQNADGSISGRELGNFMYGHALATIALCEAYALTKEASLGERAQAAIRYLEWAQNREGGWRYTARSDADMSVTGFVVLALKSGQMAGLEVKPTTWEGARAYLRTVASGNGGYFPYNRNSGSPSATMSAVGLLCNQYLGSTRSDAAVVEGVRYMLNNLPTTDRCNFYYWYYATLGMRNFQGPDWDLWNRKMRRLLIETQAREGCATGSWTPAGDPHAMAAGRLYATSFATLTLEVYYRYLPLYRVDVDHSAASVATMGGNPFSGATASGPPPPAGGPMPGVKRL